MAKIDKSKFNQQFTAIDRVVDFFEANRNKAFYIHDIVETINYKQRNKLSLGSIMRFINHFLEVYKGLFIRERNGRRIYYKLKSSNTINKKTTKKSFTSQKPQLEPNKLSKRKNNANLKVKEINNGEKSLYPIVQNILDKHSIHGNKFKFVVEPIRGETKWNNPDLMGTNTDALNISLVSVEVKKDSDINVLLTGFAQCCSYNLFSDYVYYFCNTPKSEEDENRIINLCKFYGIGLCFLDKTPLSIHHEAKFNNSDLKDTQKRIKYNKIVTELLTNKKNKS